jgi:hypothetical protein
MRERLQELASGSAVFYGRVGGLWVMILHKPPVEADMLLARGSLMQMARSEPHGFPTLTWILPSAGFSLDAPSKEAAAKITSEFSKSILARATLIEGTGFQAAAVRAVVTGIDLFSRTTSPGRVFAELEATVAWCVSLRPAKSPSTLSASLITRALEETVASLRPVGTSG